ncbi:Cyclin-U1-1 [Hondaea fermentalgiana]|uniref:Cyclin-U1-1 n=1 Tax=Hondaea fermentalgiana TaxID=2315210 RepID=A0A2R5G747_9STRA|nr:Cyclin-U1-1 [Hondaea fermentalgiana]|eukprot:GBG26886.1 Cyclin-U1-1 [Hondaea fermentalgiana]
MSVETSPGSTGTMCSGSTFYSSTSSSTSSSRCRRNSINIDAHSDHEGPLKAGKRPRPLERVVISTLGKALGAMANRAKDRSKTADDAFDGPSVPEISMENYLYRLAGYLNQWQGEKAGGTSLGLRALIMGLVYVDRLCARDPGMMLSPVNIHRICMTTTLVAVKSIEDAPFLNSFWCQVGGVSLHELNALELHLLKRLDWDVNVSREEFDRTFAMLRSVAAV